MDDYAGIVAMSGLGLAAVALAYGLALLTAVHRSPLTALPFQSGHLPQEHALSRYHVRWYPMTLLFLAFDIEMLFMYPWALVVLQEGLMAVVEMFIFLGILLVGVVWVWREGALRWV